MMISEIFQPIEERFIELSNRKKFIKECSFAMQAINGSPQLQDCSIKSKIKSVLNVAFSGLTLDPIKKYAHLIARNVKNKNGKWNYECCLDISYKGLSKLITDTGSVINIYCYPVYESDEFEIAYGSKPEVIHRPKFKSKDIIGAYAIAVLKDGSQQFEHMTKEEIDEIREMSTSYKAFKEGRIKSCIWTKHEGEMSRKTVLRRLTKYLPQTDQWEHVHQAIRVENDQYELGLDSNLVLYALRLVESSSYDDDNKQIFELELHKGISKSRLNEIIDKLKVNQLDPIESGNYSQTDLIKR